VEPTEIVGFVGETVRDFNTAALDVNVVEPVMLPYDADIVVL
jgi:hypothetical protein